MNWASDWWPLVGTAKVIADAGLPVQAVNKVLEGRPHVVDMIKNEEIDLIVNTTEGKQAIADSSTIRRTALRHDVYCTTPLRVPVRSVRHSSAATI
jgi:carbamoyl-phosphate synthase large subunit